MLSSVTGDKVLDWHYKKLPVCYNFFLGDICIGQIFKFSKHNWSAVPIFIPSKSINGFGSRYHASNYMVELYQKLFDMEVVP